MPTFQIQPIAVENLGVINVSAVYFISDLGHENTLAMIHANQLLVSSSFCHSSALHYFAREFHLERIKQVTSPANGFILGF